MACKRWLQRTIQMRWTRGKKWDMPNYTRTWLKSCGSNTSKFEVFGSTCCKYVRRRSGESYHIECLQPSTKRVGGSVMVWEGISLGWCWKSKLMELWTQNLLIYHVESIWYATNSFNILEWSQTHCQCKKKNTIKHYQSWMASPQPEPDHYWSQHPKKSFVCSSRGSKKYSWKLLNALIRKLS